MKHRCTRIVHKALAVVRPQFRLHFAGGVHGLPHWSRVWFHGRALATSLDVDPAVPAWFAFLHDSQRHNDGRDPAHGARAADFAVRLRRQGVIDELDHPAFERLCEAMRLHSDGHTTGDAAVLACWDADRLDLARVGIQPEPQRLVDGNCLVSRVNGSKHGIGRFEMPTLGQLRDWARPPRQVSSRHGMG